MRVSIQVSECGVLFTSPVCVSAKDTELAKYGITVNAYAPGAIETDLCSRHFYAIRDPTGKLIPLFQCILWLAPRTGHSMRKTRYIVSLGTRLLT